MRRYRPRRPRPLPSNQQILTGAHMADTFKQTVKQTTGAYNGDYLWSSAGNWSTGALPAANDAVTLNLSQGFASVVDNTISVASVSYSSSGSLLIGGSLTTGSLGVATGLTGQSLSVLSKGSLHVTGTLNLGSGTLDIAGSAAINSLALTGGLTIEGSTTVASIGGGGITINAGGALEITTQTSSALSSGGDIFTLDGGTLRIDSGVVLLASTSFSFGSVATYGVSTLDLRDIASNVNAYNVFSDAINLMGAGDSIEVGTSTFSSATPGTHSLLLTGSNGGPSYTLNNLTIAASTNATTFSLSTAADGGTLITLNCFLAGTRIETATGAMPIEALSVGDLVVTIEAGARVLKPVRWIGTREVDAGGLDEDAARDAAPVRICAHAFADNVPARDLLVTADHCVFEADGLIPARMLVNGASILRETDRVRYRVHHLEFATHSILLSEGLTTESYLDTGARAGFGLPDADAPCGASWADDAAAPLLTARAAVEPVWRRLAARAGTLGMAPANPVDVVRTTSDAAVRLRLADGVLLHARRRRGERHFFVLPAGCAHATLQSRSAVPAEIEGPFVDDRRRLGLCVRRMQLWTDLRSTELAFGTDGASGWHREEAPGGCRWTDGEAGFGMPAQPRATILEVELTGLAGYLLPDRSRRVDHGVRGCDIEAA